MDGLSEGMLEELTALARAVAGDERVTLVEGPNWRVNLVERRIEGNFDRELSLDAVRALVCHEAGHLVMTHQNRYFDTDATPAIAELDDLRKAAFHEALNAIEDCRLERWLCNRLPGCAPWLAEANQQLGIPVPDGSLGELRWWGLALGAYWLPGLGYELADMPPRVAHVLAATDAAVRDYIHEQPPVHCDVQPGIRAQYRGVVARAFDEAPEELSLFACACRVSAWHSYLIFRDRIWPHLRPLLESDIAAGRYRPETRPRRRGLVRLDPGEEPPSGPQVRLPPLLRSEPLDYGRLRRELAQPIRRLKTLLEKQLLPNDRPRLVAGYATGTRLDLRRAMAFDADPRRYEGLWMRREAAVERRHQVLLLVDLSGSMRGEKVLNATKGAVLIAETATALDLPLAIVGFQDEPIPFKDFHQPLSAVHAALAAMPQEASGCRPGGHNHPSHNNDGQCLAAAHAQLAAMVGGRDDRGLLIVLSDGLPEPSHGDKEAERAKLRATIAATGADPRLTLVGLGVGPRTGHVRNYYPHARANVPVEQLPDALAAVLGATISDADRAQTAGVSP